MRPTYAVHQTPLSATSRTHSHTFHIRQLVVAVLNWLCWHIGPHDEGELPFRRRQPVGAGDRVGRFRMRDRYRERAVAREFEFISVETDGADIGAPVGRLHGPRP